MVIINKNFNIDTNFWELNPQLIIISPFSELYKLGEEISSKYAWACFFMCDPDVEVNRLFNLPEDVRKQNIETNYFNEDMSWDIEQFQECLEQYPFVCMTPTERALKEEYDSLRKRAKLIRESDYTLDYTDPDTGKTIKGTATQLDTMRSKTLNIYKQIEQALALFKKDKEDARVYGGRKETLSEQDLI